MSSKQTTMERQRPQLLPGPVGRFVAKAQKEIGRNKYVYLMLLPVIIYYGIFEYGPMYGVVIAFKDYIPMRGIWESPWVGFSHFVEFFQSWYFWRLIRNTFLLSFYDLLFGFPAPIVLALLLNEITSAKFKRTVQTITYLPHFISLVVIVGIIMDFLRRDGAVNTILGALGTEPVSFMLQPEWFRTVYVSSEIWQSVGWGSIIYLAALSSINVELYEAAYCDGAGRWAQIRYVTIPGLMPTIVILLILRMGKMMTVGFEKIILMYNPLTYETADAISSYVYRRGLIEADFSYSAAIGLLNAVLNFVILVVVNKWARRVSDTSLW